MKSFGEICFVHRMTDLYGSFLCMLPCQFGIQLFVMFPVHAVVDSSNLTEK